MRRVIVVAVAAALIYFGISWFLFYRSCTKYRRIEWVTGR